MTMDKHLILGANGLIGRNLAILLDAKGEKWVGSCNKRLESGLRHVDITRSEELDAFISPITPHVVFHCANLAGGVDFCEKYPEKARAFHYDATVAIGEICKRLGSRFVYISSDYVFPDSSQPIDEDAKTGPLNEYGKLKLRSEEWITNAMKDFLIIRTTNVYGWDPNSLTPNYVMNVLNTVGSGRPFVAPSYLWGTPTYVTDLVRAIFELVERGETGIYHVVGPDFVNRFEWAVEICRSFGLNYMLIEESKTKPEHFIPRPLMARLSTVMLQNLSISSMNGMIGGLGLMKQEMERQIRAKS